MAEGLSDIEKETLKSTFDDLVVDTPKTQIAAQKYKNLMSKAKANIAKALRDILVDIASEAAKKALFGQ